MSQVLAREEFKVLLELRNLAVSGATDHAQKSAELSFLVKHTSGAPCSTGNQKQVPHILLGATATCFTHLTSALVWEAGAAAVVPPGRPRKAAGASPRSMRAPTPPESFAARLW